MFVISQEARNKMKFRSPLYENGAFKEWFYWGLVDGHWISPSRKIDDDEIKMQSFQCTGLMDKNGKDIYEGDIVWHINHYHVSDGMSIYQFKNHILSSHTNDLTTLRKALEVVKWDNGSKYNDRGDGYCWYGYQFDSLDHENGVLKEYEVVGNVIENEELTK